MLTSPLISTWKYLVLGKECEEPEIMSDYHSVAVILPFANSSVASFKGLMLLFFFNKYILQERFKMH